MDRKATPKRSMRRSVMSKWRVITVILYAIAVILVVSFGFLLWMDYTVHYPYGSAPFSIYVIERAIELLVPAALCFAVGIAIKRRTVKK